MKTPCPRPEEWQALLAGEISDAGTQRLERHLGECADCRRVLDRFSGHGAATFDFANETGATASTSPSLEQAISRLKNGGEAEPARKKWDISPYLQTPSRPDSIGRFGTCEVLEVIAHGGMAIVVKAHESALDRVVAIKILAPALADDDSFRRRFLYEARTAAALNHDNVIVIHAVGEEAGLPFLVMQHIKGPTLQQWLDLHGPLAADDVIRVARQVAAGLEAAHARGLIHRDVKPGNILLEQGLARIRLTDFGLVHSVNTPVTAESGLVAGTPQYMSPEQAAGGILDVRSDLFSLGAVMLAMATGQPPFQGKSLTELLQNVRECNSNLLALEQFELPAALRDLIGQLLARRVTERPASAAEVETRLAGLLKPGPAGRGTSTWLWRIAAAIILLSALYVWNQVRNPDLEEMFATFALASSGEKFASLADAVAASQPGDVIEITGNKPTPTEPVLVRHPLRIRAAAGSAPLLYCNSAAGPMISAEAALVLEGITLEQNVVIMDAPPFIRITNAELHLAYCRLQKRSVVARSLGRRIFCVEVFDAPRVEISHCEFVPLERAVASVFARYSRDQLAMEPVAATVAIRRSLILGIAIFELENRAEEPVRLTLNDSILISRGIVRSDDLSLANRIQVVANNLVADAESLVIGMTLSGERFRRDLQWAGRSNRYSMSGPYAGELLRRQGFLNSHVARNFKDWTNVVGVSEVDSRTIALNLRRQFLESAVRFEDFTLDGLELPADLMVNGGPRSDSVGPGSAYDVWRESDSYEVWEQGISTGSSP